MFFKLLNACDLGRNRITNNLIFSILLISIFSVVNSCTPKIGEEPPKQDSIEFSGGQCLTEAMPVVKKFVGGDANDIELAQAWDCLKSAFQKFKKYVRGRQANEYQAMELATFFEDNFFDRPLPGQAKRVQPSLVNELMQFKVMFVGGNDQIVTRSELDSTILLMEEFKSITLRVNPYMKVYLFDWKGSDSPVKDQRFFENADQALQDAARRLGGLILRNNTSYNLDRIPIFLKELAKFYREDWSSIATVEKYLPVAKKVKKAVAGGEEGIVGTQEWKRFLLLGARGFSQYIRYYYFIENANGSAGGRRLGYVTRAVEDVFSIFQDLVSEKPTGVVSKQELFEILNSFSQVWPEFKVSPKLLDQLMLIKVAFFGGSSEQWDVVDFEQGKVKIPRIKAILEKIWPYFSIYSFEWQWDLYPYDEARVILSESEQALSSAAQDLGDLINGSYDLNSLVSLLGELDSLYPPAKPEDSIAQSVKRYLPLGIEVKKTILGDRDSIIKRNQWSSVLEIAARSYIRYLDYRYFVSPYSVEERDTLKSMIQNVDSSYSLAVRILQIKGGEQRFELDELNRLMLSASKADLISSDIQPETLSNLISLVLERVLNPYTDRLDSNYRPQWLDAKALWVAKSELISFLKLRFELSDIFLPGVVSVKDAKTLSPAEFVEELRKRVGKTVGGASVESLAEYLRVVDSPVPMVLDEKGRLQISNRQDVRYDLSSANSMTTNVLIARLILRSFANDKARIENYSGITVDELEFLYRSAKPLLVDLRLIEASNDSFASSRFREANIFTPHGNGDDLGSFEEIADIATMIFSGLKLNSLLKKDLIEKCLPKQDKDYPVTQTVKISCVANSYRDQMPEDLQSMPEYVAYMKSASKAEWNIYFMNVLKSAGYIPNDKNEVKLGDLALAPHVIQYLEMTVARFDRNKDGFLATNEAVKAFPSFRALLLKLAADDIKEGNIKEKDMLPLFTFILRHGHPPLSISEKAKWILNWKNRPSQWDVWADRNQLAKILGYIADELAKSAAKAKKIN